MRTTKTASKKQGYHHGDLRRALLDAAAAILEKEGAQALTLREVARRAGVTHAAPYRHFLDKESLLAAVAKEGFEAMVATMEERRARAPEDPIRQLQEVGVGYVLFAVAHPGHFSVMFGRVLPDPKRHPEMAAAGMAAFGVLTGSVALGQQAGRLRAGDPMGLALACWSMVHGLSKLLVDGELTAFTGRSPEEMALLASRVLTEGLGSGKELIAARRAPLG